MRCVRLGRLDESTYFQLSSPLSPPSPFVSQLLIRTFPSPYPPLPGGLSEPRFFRKRRLLLTRSPCLDEEGGI